MVENWVEEARIVVTKIKIGVVSLGEIGSNKAILTLLQNNVAITVQ